jgi:hypothetical protein
MPKCEFIIELDGKFSYCPNEGNPFESRSICPEHLPRAMIYQEAQRLGCSPSELQVTRLTDSSEVVISKKEEYHHA